ncbi:uncharacterized protein EI90DRAFT_2978467 [Cantharellus anzutake]|uniref:uncharacterized protein n=1 Tax=Cantharellus anzutake TaxID=1750568 RepID=UPI001905B464|nr:uncharacterized protein EI90DRAFT_2978876 [Cantharellus anzutake]XP_038910107.1 uncharacterized protein EI90DRAFT_2978467 [Cantharellus anzutake]KAF8318303.1 hypothetical protein EI90DRAFT_2978876 [Cantharellus anzutake]KAF8319556.1 hypothetical protein EI90DRAFT_2978467 [Cantharellus anzutake]
MNHSLDPATKKPSKHATFYRELVPAMIPIFILGSAVYMVRSMGSLHLTRNYLGHEKYVREAKAEIASLKQHIEILQSQASPASQATPSSPINVKRWWSFSAN